MIVFNIFSSSKKLCYRGMTMIYLEDSLAICSFRKTTPICYYFHHGNSLTEFWPCLHTCYKCISAREHPKFSHECLVTHKNCPATAVFLLGIYCLKKNHHCCMKRMVLGKNTTLVLSHRSAQLLLVLRAS